jgi:hypothetical protein
VYIKSLINFSPRRVSASTEAIFRELSLTTVSSEHTGMTKRIAVLLICYGATIRMCSEETAVKLNSMKLVSMGVEKVRSGNQYVIW